MEQSAKTLFSLIITFLGMLLLVTCLAFYLLSTQARQTLYTVIEYVEINGYNEEVIQEYAQETNTIIQVEQLDVEEGERYEVKVSFSHVFAWLNFEKMITFTGTTRQVNY